MSLPTRGEWIEIGGDGEENSHQQGLSPHGESGVADLKAPSDDRMMEFNRILYDFGIPIYKF